MKEHLALSAKIVKIGETADYCQRTQYKPGAPIWTCLEILTVERWMGSCAGGCAACESPTKQPRILFNHSPTQVSVLDLHRGPLTSIRPGEEYWTWNTESEGDPHKQKILKSAHIVFQPAEEERNWGNDPLTLENKDSYFFQIVTTLFLGLSLYSTQLVVQRECFCFKAFLYYHYLICTVCMPSREAI